jgi:hypothetical protein
MPGNITLILFSFFSFLFCQSLNAQITSPYGIEVTPISVEGAPIRSVVILLKKEGKEYIADSLETTAFYKAFGLKPGGNFMQSIADLAIRTIVNQPEIKTAEYHVYNSEYGGPVVLVVNATFLAPGELKSVEGKKGMSVAGGLKSFPLITQTDHSKLTFILNGGAGLFNEINALFSKGPEFTQGNPIATNPATKGTRFWGEAYIEPGIAGITRLGKSKLYPYAAVSYLISGRNSSDIYSDGPTAFGGFERLYAGLLIPKLGKNQNVNIDVSAGRQFFQLNDGFLFSRFSGSANAGERGSVYLNSRTTYQMSALAKVQISKFTLSGFFLEPQELFKNSQSNTRFLGGTFNFNNNKHFDLGVSYISVPSTKSQYSTPQGRIPMEGMYILNPKVWISNIAETGLFIKSEYAYQGHNSQDMKSDAWYVGAGIVKKKWKHSPGFYYRYAYMKGDDSNTPRYERFDAIQTGGLGNWVQGINFRKISGDGNLLTHRVEVKGYVKRNFEVSLDYFFLRAETTSNLGSLAPISNLNGKVYGHEVTATSRYFIGRNYLLLGVFSWAKPGDAVVNAFEDPVYNWTSLQVAMFMFF